MCMHTHAHTFLLSPIHTHTHFKGWSRMFALIKGVFNVSPRVVMILIGDVTETWFSWLWFLWLQKIVVTSLNFSLKKSLEFYCQLLKSHKLCYNLWTCLYFYHHAVLSLIMVFQTFWLKSTHAWYSVHCMRGRWQLFFWHSHTKYLCWMHVGVLTCARLTNASESINITFPVVALPSKSTSFNPILLMSLSFDLLNISSHYVKYPIYNNMHD